MCSVIIISHSQQTRIASLTIGVCGNFLKTEICRGGHVIACSRQVSVVYRTVRLRFYTSVLE